MKQEYNNISMSSLAETNRFITSLAQMITTEKVEQKDPFWNNSAKNLLEGLIGFFLEEYKKDVIKENKITMTSIRKFQNSTMEDKNLKIFKNYLNHINMALMKILQTGGTIPYDKGAFENLINQKIGEYNLPMKGEREVRNQLRNLMTYMSDSTGKELKIDPITKSYTLSGEGASQFSGNPDEIKKN